MDNDALIAHARSRFDHAAAKKLLQEKYQAKLIFTYNQGMFRAGPELLVLLHQFLGEHIVILDLYHNPIPVDASELHALAKGRWQEQMTAWLVEHEQNNQQR